MQELHRVELIEGRTGVLRPKQRKGSESKANNIY